MTEIRLLAVVEVPQSDRVVCQAPACKHPVYKRIHVVQENGTIAVLGSECFKKLHGETLSGPRYGSSEGRLLTPEERQLLLENTARLVAQFESEHQAALQRAAAWAAAQKPVSPPPRAPAPDRLAVQAAEIQAKLELRNSMGIDPDLPGWQGLVQARVRELLR